MKANYIVYNENWMEKTECETLNEAKALRYQKYGYAGHIIEYKDGEEIADHS
jgi:hypothetical protein